jgi:energy-coupling factor transporter ATP-binding protein EcfA2
MPGSRMNDTERHLENWWNSTTTNFINPVLSGISIKGTPGLRGITDLDITFEYPFTVICGQNGSGKTTLLALAALAFHSPEGHHSYQARNYKPRNLKSYYTFVDFFFKGSNDPDITGVEIVWKYRGARISEKKIRKQSRKWMKYETRPKRPVHYFGASRILPAIERNVLRNHFRVKSSQQKNIHLNDDFREIFCRILSRPYADATVTMSKKYSLRSCVYGSTYTSFNMGAGEDTLIEMLYYLQQALEGSLIVIEEIELGLHPEAQKKFAEELLKITLAKKFQIITSSHSSEFIDNVPRNSRILIQRIGPSYHNIVKAPTTRYAMGFLHGAPKHELTIYCEDPFAEKMIKKAITPDIRRRTRIIGVGGIDQIAKQCGGHVRADFPGKYLGVFDGDVNIAEGEAKIIREMPSNIVSINCSSLPGNNLEPEKWVLREILDNESFLENLKFELKEDNIETIRSSLQRLVVLDHHDIVYGFKQNMGLDYEDAEDMLIKISCIANSNFDPLLDKINEVLNN